MDIDLATAVATVRDELLYAAATGASEDLRFAVGPIEMEFAVELKEDSIAKAGFKAWVVSAEAQAGTSDIQTHRVKFTLTPKLPTGQDLLISADEGAVLRDGGAPRIGR
ncbi:trypco2 family protein [Micromonospora sp. NPDC049891]|uniref:trypco2 family protein n=1 Tax=Micromonospora sp. NPDC049891 TaxID=3155655 RepID=UPI0033DC4ED3